MCIGGLTQETGNNNHPSLLFANEVTSLSREEKQEKNEYEASRRFRIFNVRFFPSRTLSGDKARFVFVDASEYGIVWGNVAFFVLSHILWVFCLWKLVFASLGEWLYYWCFGMMGGIGVTAGVHRLWSHKAYTANLPLRIFLAIWFTSVGQNDIYTWCRDHRLHHKFTETDADPHNSRRGAFFAHVGWLLTKKHPDVLLKGVTINNDDLLNDPVVHYQKKYYGLWYLLFRVLMPGLIPYYFMGSSLTTCVVWNFCEYVIKLHGTWFVNSAAHMFGDRPYNDKIQPRENKIVAFFAFNEGFHNYHHQFPWDWRIAEDGLTWYDPGKWFIGLNYLLGFATNLKEASPRLVEATKNRVDENAHKESMFYVEDHPYFIPHPFSGDPDLGSVDKIEGKMIL